jgi:hypothetical protein
MFDDGGSRKYGQLIHGCSSPLLCFFLLHCSCSRYLSLNNCGFDFFTPTLIIYFIKKIKL